MYNQFLVVTPPSFLTKSSGLKAALFALSFILLSSPFVEVKAQVPEEPFIIDPVIDLEIMGQLADEYPDGGNFGVLHSALTDLLGTTGYSDFEKTCKTHCTYFYTIPTQAEWNQCLEQVLSLCHASRMPGGANCRGISVTSRLFDYAPIIRSIIPCP
ncbi:MAG: hypothetical protein ACK502_09535 [Alphaproteobacteria bacterium]